MAETNKEVKNTDYKIKAHLDTLSKAYNEPMKRLDGLLRRPKEIIRTVEFYSVDQFLSGEEDELGREKPFINHGNSRVRVAKTATDLDVKDIRFEPDYLTYAAQAMVYNHELYKWMKDSNFSLTLNDTGLTRPKYGEVMLKRTETEDGLFIDVVDWVNVEFDPTNVQDGTIIEKHYMDPDVLAEKADVWKGYDSITEVLQEHAKITKENPQKICIKEVTGVFPYSMDPDYADRTENHYRYKRMCFYIADLNSKKYLLYKEDLKKGEKKYKSLSWEKIGKGFGRGVWEEGFQSQVWINDQYIALKNYLDIAGKVFTKGNVKGLGNVIRDVDNGTHFDLKANEDIEAFQLSTAALPEFHNLINQFDKEWNRISSTYDANTGEQPPSGTPLGQTQLLNTVANSPFQYQTEVWANWLTNEILNDWVLPYLKKKILKDHDLVSDFSDEELDVIDESIANMHVNTALAERIFNRQPVTPELQSTMTTRARNDLRKKYGSKRQLKIPAKWLDVEGKITANISGELKNKQVALQSLDRILQLVIGSFNKNTGTYAVLEDPVLSKLFKQIIEISGIPFSSAQLGTGATKSAVASPVQATATQTA